MATQTKTASKGSNNKRLVVYSIKETANGGKMWIPIGRAFINRDGSMNLLFDALPTDAKCHVREAKPRSSDDEVAETLEQAA